MLHICRETEYSGNMEPSRKKLIERSRMIGESLKLMCVDLKRIDLENDRAIKGIDLVTGSCEWEGFFYRTERDVVICCRNEYQTLIQSYGALIKRNQNEYHTSYQINYEYIEWMCRSNLNSYIKEQELLERFGMKK